MDSLTGDEFRVLILLPGEKDEPLRCELLIRSLADHPPYEALSYVWSIKPDPARLELDGEKVAITEGLEDILFRLRYASTSRTLWIDRLCINQSNTAEKSAQVSQMRAIYSTAPGLSSGWANLRGQLSSRMLKRGSRFWSTWQLMTRGLTLSRDPIPTRMPALVLRTTLTQMPVPMRLLHLLSLNV